MFYAIVETNAGEVLNMLRRDGFTGGKALLSFILGLESFCHPEDSPEDQTIRHWFSELEQVANHSTHQSICEVAAPLLRSYYSGNWEYRENEYQAFQQREKWPINEDEFKRTIEVIRGKWVDAPALLHGVEWLREVLDRCTPVETWWYAAEDTQANLEALSDTLMLAIRRGADQVRIRIE